MENIKQLNLSLSDSSKKTSRLEIQKHTIAGWAEFKLVELKRGFNNKGEMTERMYTTYFSLDKETKEKLKDFLLEM